MQTFRDFLDTNRRQNIATLKQANKAKAAAA